MTGTATLTLTDFLLARIAEDEAVARAAREPLMYGYPDYQTYTDDSTMAADNFIKKLDPARILAECEAKRRIVTLMGYVRESWENSHSGEGRVMWPDVNRREKMHALTILETLALPYADHSDYREEWRP